MATLNERQKQEITEALRAYVAKYPSQNKASASLNGVSSATISQILNGKTELVSDEMWRNVASQVMGSSKGWNITETRPFKEIYFALADAQSYQNVTWVVAPAGCGKTTTANAYKANHKEVFMIQCSEDMRKNDLVGELATAIGISQTERYTSSRNLLKQIIARVIQMEAPLLIFDEADKLSDKVFQYFITLYNTLEDKAGIIFLSTNFIKRRMSNGLRYNKQGYQELDSRLGRKFYEVDPADAKDIYMICSANDISDEKSIREIIGEISTCQYDLRRVKKAVHKAKRKQSK